MRKRTPEPIVCTPDILLINGRPERSAADIFNALLGSAPKTEDPLRTNREAEELREQGIDNINYDPEAALQQRQYGQPDGNFDPRREYGEPVNEYAIYCRVFIENDGGPLSEESKVQLARLRNNVRRELVKQLGTEDVDVEDVKAYRPASHKEFRVTVRGSSLQDIADKLGVEPPYEQDSKSWLCKRITSIAAELSSPIAVVDNKARYQQINDDNEGMFL